MRLREELRAIDVALKKYKKQVHRSATARSIEYDCVLQAKPVGAAKVAPVVSSSGETKAGKGGAMAPALSIDPAPPLVVIGSTLNPAQVAVVQGPAVGRPCLQSSRLFVTDSCSGVSKNLFRKMNSYLLEIGLPERPVPTKAVCDLVDRIRKETVTLLSLHHSALKKEKTAATAGAGAKAEKVSKGSSNHWSKMSPSDLLCS